jgi:hypothetical protein
VLPNLLKEASACFPATLADLAGWQPPWQATTAGPARPVASLLVELSPAEAAVRALLVAASASTNALARLLGLEPAWQTSPAAGSPTGAPGALSDTEAAVHGLLRHHPATMQAQTTLLQSPLPG